MTKKRITTCYADKLETTFPIYRRLKPAATKSPTKLSTKLPTKLPTKFKCWIPAFAGMTLFLVIVSILMMSVPVYAVNSPSTGVGVGVEDTGFCPGYSGGRGEVKMLLLTWRVQCLALF